MKACLFAFCTASSALVSHAADLYVDKNGTKDFTTIQSAVESAQEGDTVWVLPGEYDSGGWVDGNGFTNRVYLNKTITLRATSGNPADTHIVGAWDENGDAQGRGPAAVRGIYVDNQTSNTVVRGFTIRNCTSPSTNSVNNGGAAGATVVLGKTLKNNWFVDCAFEGNAGKRGANAYGGYFLRCKFGPSYGTESVQDAILVNCLIIDHPSTGNDQTNPKCGGNYLISGGAFYNCTFYNNANNYFASSHNKVYNCLLTGAGNSITYSSGHVEITHSILGLRYDNYYAVGMPGSNGSFTQTYSKTVGSNMQFIAPAFGDFRLLSTSDAVGYADASHLNELLNTVIPPAGVNIWKDFRGADIPQTGAINAGCCQETITPAGGAILASGDGLIIGSRPVTLAKYFYPEQYPTQIHASAAMKDGEGLFGFKLQYGGGKANEIWRYPMMDDTLWFMPHPDANIALTCSVQKAESIVNVDPVLGNDETADGSSALPYKTLQGAVSGSLSFGLIVASKGNYDEGGEFAYAHSNRVVLTKSLRLIGAGAEKSFIWGRADDTRIDDDGIGPNAMRCAADVSTNLVRGCIQGFTFINGHAGKSAGGNSFEDYGGAFRMNQSVYVTDSVISNCVAARGGAGAYTPLIRCVVTCSGYPGKRLIEGAASLMNGCVVYNLAGKDGNLWKSKSEIPSISDTKNYHTTIIATDINNAPQRALGSGHITTNCITSGGTAPSNGWGFQNDGLFISATWKMPESDTNGKVQHTTNGKAHFAAPERRDYRLRSTSEVFGTGVYDPNMYKWYEPVMDGPIVFINGKPTPGAYQRPLPVVTTPESLAHCTMSPAGETVVEEGESITISLSNATRPPEGLLINGEFADISSYTYTAPSFGEYGNISITDIKPVFSTNWYVNATSGSDENDGFTPDTAKKTLAGIMSCAITSGDRIHAAAGDYNEKSMPATNLVHTTTLIGTRVVIPQGVSLVADEGPETTFITGADAPAEYQTSYGNGTGLGTNSIRCVYMYENSFISGFTIRNGRTLGDISSSSSKPDCYGGGLIVRSGGLIENCVITNCASRRCGGSCGGTFVRCKFLDNKTGIAESWGDTFPIGGVYNCLFDWNDTYVSAFPMINCFVGSNNSHSYSVYASSGAQIQNTICCKLLRMNSNTGILAPTNVYCTGFGGNQDLIDKVHITTTTSADILNELDADNGYRIKNLDSIFVDSGTNEALGFEYLNKDLLGGQRVYNGKIDIGPYEYDWRDYFASKIGAVSVSKASADVTTNAYGKVRIPDGASIEMTPLSRDARRVSFAVNNGELAISGGLEDKAYTTDGVYKFMPPTTLSFAFDGPSGYADIEEIFNKPGSLMIIR